MKKRATIYSLCATAMAIGSLARGSARLHFDPEHTGVCPHYECGQREVNRFG
jgi:hypothetical protein